MYKALVIPMLEDWVLALHCWAFHGPRHLVHRYLSHDNVYQIPIRWTMSSTISDFPTLTRNNESVGPSPIEGLARIFEL